MESQRIREAFSCAAFENETGSAMFLSLDCYVCPSGARDYEEKKKKK